MIIRIGAVALLSAATMLFSAPAKQQVKLETTKGVIVIELNAQAAPKTVANFIQYVKDGFYNGTVFHRVIPGFMIQGGGLTADMQEKPTRPEIVNEADNGLKNVVGTVAMARKPDPNSASAQFFINTKDNVFLDFKSRDQAGFGYCVFGKVIEGMEVMRAIEGVPTKTGGMYENVPVTPVLINKATLVGAATTAPPAAK